MAIIISKNGSNAKKIDKSEVEKEDFLQNYIHNNPESIPVYELAEDKKLFVAKREFPTNSGSIDALAIDKDGDIYVVETKLYKNPDKRTVIAQALDYGAALWKHMNDFSEFIRILDEEIQKKFRISFEEKIKEIFSLDDELYGLMTERLKENLNEGNLKFVILMDTLDERLKDLILYVNQNSQFDIYAVQLEFYKYEDYEITIPKLFGAEVKKNMGASTSSSVRRRWTEKELLQDAKQALSPREYKGFEQIYNFSKQYASELRLGTGSYGSFSPIFGTISERSLFTLSTDKRLAFNFEWTAKVNEEVADTFKKKLEAIGFSFPDNFKELRPSVLTEEWLPKTDNFIGIIKEMLK